MTTITSIVSVTKDSPGAGQVTIVANYADQTFTQPAQRVTVGEFPATNPNWSRALRLTDAAFFVIRTGSNAVAILTTVLSAVAVALENTLTWAPRITVQPANASTSFAKGTLTWDAASGPTNGDTVTIGSKVYTFKTALTPTEGEVLLNGGGDAAMLNLIRAINHSGTPDTDYKCAAANTQVTAAVAVTAHAFVVTSKVVGTAANAIATTETSAHLAWSATTLLGGTAAAAFAVTATTELAATYAWFESADGTTFGSALASAGIYSGATSATLTITPTDTSKNGYWYRSTVTNGAGATTTSKAQLAVT